jgi:hypothetical protein
MVQVYKSYSNGQGSILKSLTSRLNKSLIRHFGKSFNDDRYDNLAKLLDNEPHDSPYNSQALLQRLEKLLPQFLNTDLNRKNLQAWSEPFQQFRQEANITIAERRVFRTDNGLFGCGPLDIEAEDEVWIVAGSKTPLVLRRKVNSSYILLGDSYVHGCMHGQTLEQLQAEGRSWVDIIIQ